MIIKRVEAIPYSLPYKRPIIWATGALYAADHLLVVIETEDGTCGYSEAIPRIGIYGETQESIYFTINKYLAPLVVGEDSFNIDKIWEKMGLLYWNPAAKGAIDVALYDLNGKLLNTFAANLLGGQYRSEIPVSWQIAFDTPENMIAEMQRKYGEGYRAFKVKGGPHPDQDIEILKAMRASAEPGTRLYIDANITYSRSDCKRVMRALEGIIDALEEPMQPWDTVGRQIAFDSTTTPTLSDESSFTVPDVYHQLRQGLMSEIGIKIPRTGYTQSRKIVALAEAANVPVQISTQAESMLGTAAGAVFASAFRQVKNPCELTYFVENIADEIVTTPLVVENGKMKVPTGLGIGMEIDWNKVDQYRVKITG